MNHDKPKSNDSTVSSLLNINQNENTVEVTALNPPGVLLQQVEEPTDHLATLNTLDHSENGTNYSSKVSVKDSIPRTLTKDRSFSTDNSDHQNLQQSLGRAKPFLIPTPETKDDPSHHRGVSYALEHTTWFTQPGISFYKKLDLIFQDDTQTPTEKAKTCFKAIQYCYQLEDKESVQSEYKQAVAGVAIWLQRLEEIWFCCEPQLNKEEQVKILQLAQDYLDHMIVPSHTPVDHLFYNQLITAKVRWKERQASQSDRPLIVPIQSEQLQADTGQAAHWTAFKSALDESYHRHHSQLSIPDKTVSTLQKSKLATTLEVARSSATTASPRTSSSPTSSPRNHHSFRWADNSQRVQSEEAVKEETQINHGCRCC